MELMPVMIRPSTSRLTPVSGTWVGERRVHGPADAAHRRTGTTDSMSRPPARKTQNERALTRGKAMSAAPTWSGTM